MSVNEVRIIGNIGNDPEVNFLPSGAAACNFTVATSETWKDKQTGEQKEKTEWHRCKAFDRGNYKMAEYIGQSCHKGTKIYIKGSLETREWEKEGVKRYTTEIKVEDFEVLANGVPREQQGQAPQQGQQPTPQNAPAQSWGDPWIGLKPAGAAAHLTIEQIKQDPSIQGNAQAALNFGWAIK